jgi:hypothetical protein
MAYTVNKTNSSASPNQFTVQDSVLNTQTNLSLLGKGYDGYAEVVAENFLHLLENFSNTTAPTKPITGQLWYDETEGRLKVYQGSSFNPVTSASYQSFTPSGQVAGDLWVDSTLGQLYFYNGTANVLVGPRATTTSGHIFSTIKDSTDADKPITELFNNSQRIAIISETAFTPKLSIAGFSTITQGLQLSTDISGLKFTGTATNADALGGTSAANFLTSNANDTTSGSLGITNDLGLTVGADSDLSVTVDASGVIFSNVISDTDITFKVNDGGVTTTLMHMDGALSRIGIGTATPSTKLQVVGTVTATAFTGNVTGNVTGDVTGNIAGSGTSSLGATTLAGTLTSKAILPDTTTTYDIGSTSKKYNTVHAQATSAQYADLAEIYESDSEYEVGTVVIFGGDKEITVSSMGADPRVAGVISENPAYLMNSEATGQAVALQGKVKCKVIGVIGKGDMLVTHSQHPGVARKGNDPAMGTVIGKALENYNSIEIGTINIVAGRI